MKKSIIKEIRNPSLNGVYPLSLHTSNFSLDKLPYVFFRNHDSICMIDVSRLKAYLLLSGKNLNNWFDSPRTMLVNIAESEESSD